MSDSSLLLEIGGNQLLAVPAIPYRLTFAKHVNRLCRNENTKPDAIAIELGPQSTKECALWLQELTDKYKRDFPSMLAITKENTRIRSTYKELAAKLQETSGKDLNDLSPDVLKHLLNYSAKSVLPLSPTDSRIEAIRCALELNIPLYGVDLEETADAYRKEGKLEDPAGKSGEDLTEYAKRNVRYAEYARDEEIDKRREFAIAARLKSLLMRHTRVLFTGGLAHWGQIEFLLRNPDLRPAQVEGMNEASSTNFTRCIVHPVVAIYFMDVFPTFAGYYNRYREPVNSSNIFELKDVDSSLSPILLFNDRLEKAYQAYFDKVDIEDQNQQQDIQMLPTFKELLSNICILKQLLVPDLPTIIEAAQAAMSTQFCEILANEFMDFNWVTGKDFPDLPILASVPLQTGPYMKVEFLYPDGSRSNEFYLNLLYNRRSIMAGVSIPWRWKLEPFPYKQRGKSQKSMGDVVQPGFGDYEITWPPRDYLITAMSLDAMQTARRKGRSSVVFQGSLLDGIDVKTTLRAHIRGNEHIYVTDRGIYETFVSSWEHNINPIIWIFNPYRNKSSNTKWTLYGVDLRDIEKYVINTEKLKDVMRQLGTKYMSAASYGTEEKVQKSLERAGIANIKSIHGVLFLGLPCFSIKQEAKFMEFYNYEKFALYDGSIKGLTEMFHKRHGIDLDMTDWPVSMVRMAIPYARQEVTVIVPHGFILPRVVFVEAKKRKVDLNILPLSYFPKENIEKITTEYCVYTIPGSDWEAFPESAERCLGEKADKNRHLVPRELLNYGKIVKPMAT
jgi:hypothetical protein